VYTLCLGRLNFQLMTFLFQQRFGCKNGTCPWLNFLCMFFWLKLCPLAFWEAHAAVWLTWKLQSRNKSMFRALLFHIGVVTLIWEVEIPAGNNCLRKNEKTNNHGLLGFYSGSVERDWTGQSLWWGLWKAGRKGLTLSDRGMQYVDWSLLDFGVKDSLQP
jgi:hypothetical protein